MIINLKIFKAYDIRGIYPTDIDENNFPDIIAAIYTFFVRKTGKNNLSVVLGRDMRISAPALIEIAKKTLVEYGATVIDIDLTSTPTMYYAVFKTQADAGIQITASHNPKEWTGIKFLIRGGNKAFKVSKDTGMEEVKVTAINKQFVKPEAGGKIIDKKNILVDEVKDAMEVIKSPNTRKLKIVSDTANGMGALYLAEIFKNYPVDWVKMNFELDGNFPNHQPDPLQFNLYKDLQKKVLEEKADLGIAPDGDGDRVYFVDEKGEIVPATMITSLIVEEILAKKPGEKIVVDIRYTRNAGNLIKKLGGEVSISPVGHALITKQLNDIDGAFAGESSGHFYFRETGGAESSIRVILYVLKAIQEENKPLSAILAGFKSVTESGERNFILPDNTDVGKLLQSIIADYPEGKVSRLDGLAVDFPEWRFSIRTSNTEPLMRLNVEGEDAVVESKFKELTERILQAGATIKE